MENGNDSKLMKETEFNFAWKLKKKTKIIFINIVNKNS